MKMPSEADRRTHLAEAVARESEHALSQLRAEIAALLPLDAELTETPLPNSPLAHGVAGAGWRAETAGFRSEAALRSDALTGLVNLLRRRWLQVALDAPDWFVVESDSVWGTMRADGPDGRRYLLNMERAGDGHRLEREELTLAQGDFDWAEVGWTVPARLIGYPEALRAALLALPDGADLTALPVIRVDFNALDPDGYVDIPPAGRIGWGPRAGMVVSLTDGETRVVARLREGKHYWRLVAKPLGSARRIAI